jgi:disulfide bond formation protein DsbB
MALVIARPTLSAPWLAPEWIALAAGAFALLFAHAAQASGLVPCALCYVERWPYRAAILLAAIALGWPQARPIIRPLLVLAFAAAAAAAFVHVGVEAQWWKSPLPECAAPILNTASLRSLLASMPAHPSKPCDDPTYLLPAIKISFAQLNCAFALACTAFIAISAAWNRKPRT